MRSLEIAVLEFWRKNNWAWERNSAFEIPLADSDWCHGNRDVAPMHLRISNSDQGREWYKARKEGDFETMVRILTSFGCERAIEVAHMVDVQRRQEELAAEVRALCKERLR